MLKVDAIPSKEYHGKVVEVGSSGFNRANQPDVTFFKVKILLDDPDPNLRASMSVRAEIHTHLRGKGRAACAWEIGTHATPGDLVLIKGSRTAKTERVLEEFSKEPSTV